MSTKASYEKAAKADHPARKEAIHSGDTVVVSSAPGNIFKEEGITRATNSPDPKPEVKPEKPKPPEKADERLLRVLCSVRERVRSQGVPELDVEVDELIAELKKS